jgi:predicted PurR-regulated permease PerM
MLGLDVRAARVVWTVLVFAAAIGLVYTLRSVILLLAFAVVLAYLVFPLVRLVQKWGPLRQRRGLAVGLVYLVLLGAIAGAGAAIGPRLVDQVLSLSRKAPEMSQQLQSGEAVGNMLERRGWNAGQVREIQTFIGTHVRELTGYTQKALAAALAWVAGAWVLVLVPIFAFFFLKDAPRFVAAAESLIETRPGRGLWRGIVEDLHRVLGEYVRALIVLCLVTFAVWSTVFLLTGVPYALALAALGGALEFIPLVGPVVAGVVVVAVNGFAGQGHTLLLVGFIIVWRLIQDYVTSPLVMGSGVELHPALVIFGIVAGGEIGGVAGMFLSIPVLATIRLVWRRVHAQYHAQTGVPHGAAESSPAVTPLARRAS